MNKKIRGAFPPPLISPWMFAHVNIQHSPRNLWVAAFGTKHVYLRGIWKEDNWLLCHTMPPSQCHGLQLTRYSRCGQGGPFTLEVMSSHCGALAKRGNMTHRCINRGVMIRNKWMIFCLQCSIVEILLEYYTEMLCPCTLQRFFRGKEEDVGDKKYPNHRITVL